VVGHHDCAGNPVERSEHESQIQEALRVVRGWSFTATIVGLYVNEKWEVEVISG
jgi:hypothetical protein